MALQEKKCCYDVADLESIIRKVKTIFGSKFICEKECNVNTYIGLSLQKKKIIKKGKYGKP